MASSTAKQAKRPSPAGARPEQRQRSAKLAAVVGFVVLAAVAALALTGTDAPPGSSSDTEAWNLPVIEGEGQIQLADFKGTPTVVNFFASWCTACDAELPGFARVSDELRGEVDFVGVNAFETGNRMDMPERHGITWWPLAKDIGPDEGDLHRALGGRGMPLTAWYDADGNLLKVDGGAIDEGTLRQRIGDLYGIEV